MALGDLEITKQKQMNGGGVCIRGTIRMEQKKPHDNDRPGVRAAAGRQLCGGIEVGSWNFELSD